jgi:predicted RNA-binding Zn-ribbon protein involved in translation (DUF1610 family)
MDKMKRNSRMRRAVGRRGRFHAAIWLVGLAVLAITDRWWPGILILVVISILLETAVRRGDQGNGDDGKKPEAAPAPPPRVETVILSAEVHKAEWLPLSCPKCGAPTRAAEVRWMGDASAACPFCGSNLPLKKN